jgi:hypothetical protein
MSFVPSGGLSRLTRSSGHCWFYGREGYLPDVHDGTVHVFDGHRQFGPAHNTLEGSDIARGCDDEEALFRFNELKPVAGLNAQLVSYALGSVTWPCW